MMNIPCTHCGRQVHVSHGQEGIISEGRIILNIPGIVCGESCVDELLDIVPDTPGLVCVVELSSVFAASAIAEMEFVTGTGAAADFFLMMFPRSAEIMDTSAIRLHQEGDKEKAYSILEYGLEHSDDTDRLQLELAAFAGMDESPHYGLQLIRNVPTNTPRYYVIKGNLLREADQWDEAAACW